MTEASSDIIEQYRRHADTWMRRRNQSLMERKWLDKFLALMPENPAVLDLGCGFGEPIGKYLLANNSAVTGIDSSPHLIEAAQTRLPQANWRVEDMRTLDMGAKFDGILAWNSSFHLNHDDQRGLFSVFHAHAAKGAALMFTSGTSHGEAMGELEGEPLYHASLDSHEYLELLAKHGFKCVEHVAEDPDCGRYTIWLARHVGVQQTQNLYFRR